MHRSIEGVVGKCRQGTNTCAQQVLQTQEKYENDQRGYRRQLKQVEDTLPKRKSINRNLQNTLQTLNRSPNMN